jgi:sugar phosphate isomerase/epimerase
VNIAATDKRERIAAMDEIKRAIEVAEQIPFKFLVQHVGVGGEEFSPAKFEAAMTSVEHLRAFAKPLGVTLLLENIPNELSAPERLLELINTLHFDDMGICFDVGHAHIAAGVQETFEQLKGQIRSTHVHDNDKNADSHLWPGDGNINWAEAVALLRTAPLVPPLLMEINGEGKENVPEGMSAAFKRLEQAAQAAQP